MKKRFWLVFALIGVCVAVASLMLWRGRTESGGSSVEMKHDSGPPPESGGSFVEITSGSRRSIRHLTLTHGRLLVNERGVHIELFEQAIDACAELAGADLVLRLPDDVLSVPDGASVHATVEGGNNEDTFDQPHAGNVVHQETTFAIRSIQGGRIRAELGSRGSLAFARLTKGEEIPYHASGSIDVPICR